VTMKFVYHVSYYESVWGERNVKIYDWETNVGKHINWDWSIHSRMISHR